jgi:lysozyme family protein
LPPAARLDVNGDGKTDLADIRAVTPELADRLIYQEFYLAPGLNTLPAAVQPVLLDTAFNCGIGGATAVVKLMLRDCSLPVTADATLAQCAAALGYGVGHHGPQTMVDAIVRARIAHYRRLATKNPDLLKFLNGWWLRALHYASPDMRSRYPELLAKYHERP